MDRRERLAGAGVVAALLAWLAVVGGVGYLLYSRATWQRQTDQQVLREWLDEAKVESKSFPQLLREYIDLRGNHEGEKQLPADTPDVELKVEEISTFLKYLAEPTRTYANQLPLFPEISRLGATFPGTNWPDIVWLSPVPHAEADSSAKQLTYSPLPNGDGRAVIVCEYKLHAYNQQQRNAADEQLRVTLAVAVALLAGLATATGAATLYSRERRRLEIARATEAALLAKSLEVAQQEARAADAERTALELKSQLLASIGIMAGSYAHNIKNLLVRPNDLLARCLDAPAMPERERTMLGEVRQTLGTVTERLQQILRTVRRDPEKAALDRLDLALLARQLHTTWADLARDKWKLDLTLDVPNEPVWVAGDGSNLQQAAENLLFNARDATFEMRNLHRDTARTAPAIQRRQALLDAAAWRGAVRIRVHVSDGRAVLELCDNGIGMAEEVRRRCTEAHFTTKRDNALYEGHAAGMGLGLSFVATVISTHGGTLSIDSEPGQGTTFRLQLPQMSGD